MQLDKIIQFAGKIRLLTGLHIGAGDSEMHIGGTDNPVVKHPYTQEPYIPGSSLKGKMRSLIEWQMGVVNPRGEVTGFRQYESEMEPARKARVKQVLQLFGCSGGDQLTLAQAADIGHTRLAFWDCMPDRDWLGERNERNELLTESKSENMIDRISGVAQHPRNTERVPADAVFDFRLNLKVFRDDNEAALLDAVRLGLRLLELDSLGGSGSRGYGKISFEGLTADSGRVSLADIDPFKRAA